MRTDIQVKTYLRNEFEERLLSLGGMVRRKVYTREAINAMAFMALDTYLNGVTCLTDEDFGRLAPKPEDAEDIVGYIAFDGLLLQVCIDDDGQQDYYYDMDSDWEFGGGAYNFDSDFDAVFALMSRRVQEFLDLCEGGFDIFASLELKLNYIDLPY